MTLTVRQAQYGAQDSALRSFVSRFEGSFDKLRMTLRMAMGFGLPGEVWQEYAGYGFSAAAERCHPPMIERMF